MIARVNLISSHAYVTSTAKTRVAAVVSQNIWFAFMFSPKVSGTYT